MSMAAPFAPARSAPSLDRRIAAGVIGVHVAVIAWAALVTHAAPDRPRVPATPPLVVTVSLQPIARSEPPSLPPAMPPKRERVAAAPVRPVVAPHSPVRDATPLPAVAMPSNTPLPASATTSNEPVATASAPTSDIALASAAPIAAAATAPSAPELIAARPDHERCPRAGYPLALKERGIEGTVWLRVQVSHDGQAGEVAILRGSGWRLFDEAALQAARGCRFIPARRGDERLASWVEFPMRFALSG